MLLSQEKLSALVHGAYKIDIVDGWLSFCRFDERQLARVDGLGNECLHNASRVNSSVTVEFVTDALEIELECRFPEIRTDLDTLDIICDGVPAAVFCLTEMPKDGATVKVRLSEGEKHIAIYLPCDSIAEIRNLKVSGEVKNVVKGEKVLFIGDSITQGYGTYLASGTYINDLARLMNYEVLNQGIGGYYYDEHFLVALEHFSPDKIILAMGTNQHKSDDKEERVKEFYKKLREIYPDVQVLVITPIWRCDDGTDMCKLTELSDMIKSECKKYGFAVLDGFTLIPNDSRYYKDGLHPNATGALIYALNIKKEIDRLGF